VRAGWALLRRRDFGLLWAGGLISETGDWFLLVGLPVWVLQVTGSSLVTATVFLVGLLPGLVVGPLAGVLVDRWDRRRTLVAVSLAQAAFLLPLLAVDGRHRLWVVYLVMAAEAALAQLNDPARNALVPTLVARDDLVGANALIGLNANLARLAGSPRAASWSSWPASPGWSSATPSRSWWAPPCSGWFADRREPSRPSLARSPPPRRRRAWWGSGWTGCG
jgi:MFS family permease